MVNVTTAPMDTPPAATPPVTRTPFVAASRPLAEGATRTIIDIENLDFYYGAKQALYDINLKLDEKRVTAFIGPSGCGKSTLLRCLNRMNDLIDGTAIKRGG